MPSDLTARNISIGIAAINTRLVPLPGTNGNAELGVWVEYPFLSWGQKSMLMQCEENEKNAWCLRVKILPVGVES